MSPNDCPQFGCTRINAHRGTHLASASSPAPGVAQADPAIVTQVRIADALESIAQSLAYIRDAGMFR